MGRVDGANMCHAQTAGEATADEIASVLTSCMQHALETGIYMLDVRRWPPQGLLWRLTFKLQLSDQSVKAILSFLSQRTRSILLKRFPTRGRFSATAPDDKMKVIVGATTAMAFLATTITSLPIPEKKYILSEFQRALPTYVGAGSTAGYWGTTAGPLGTIGTTVLGAGAGGLLALGQGVAIGSYKRCKRSPVAHDRLFASTRSRSGGLIPRQ